MVSTIYFLWLEVVVDVELDEWVVGVGETEQVASLVRSLALVVVVGVVAAAHNLVGDGQTFREGIVHHIAYLLDGACKKIGFRLRINVHVASITAAAE